MLSRLIDMCRPLFALALFTVFGLPNAAADLTFDDALSLAQQQAPSLRAEASRLQAARSEAVALANFLTPNCCWACRTCPSREPNVGASTTTA